MNNLSNSARNSLIYLVQAFITTLLPLVVLLVATRHIAPDDFSAYAISLVYSVVVTGVSSLGLHLAYERNYYLYKNDLDKAYSFMFSVLLLVSCLFVLVVILTSLFTNAVSNLLGGVNNDILVVVLIGMCFEKLVSFYLIFYKNSFQAVRHFCVMVSVSVISVCISFYLILIEKIGIYGFSLAYMLSWASVFFVLSVLSFLRAKKLRFLFSDLLSTLSISLPIVPRTMTVVIGTQSDKYMLNTLSPEHLGHYALAGRLSTSLNSYMVALQNVYNPKLYEVLFKQTHSEMLAFNKLLSAIMFLSLFPVLLLSTFSYELVYLLFPLEYEFMAPLLTLFSIYYGVVFFGKIPGTVMTYSKKTGLSSLMAIFGALLNVALNFPLINYYGAIGAVFATLATGATVTFLGMCLSQRYIKLDWDYWFITVVLFFLLISAILSLVSYYISGYFEILFLSKVFFLLCSLLFFWKCGAVKMCFELALRKA